MLCSSVTTPYFFVLCWFISMCIFSGLQTIILSYFYIIHFICIWDVHFIAMVICSHSWWQICFELKWSKLKTFVISVVSVCAYLLKCCEQQMSGCYVSFTFCSYLWFITSAEKVVSTGTETADNTVEENSSIFSLIRMCCCQQGHAGSKTLHQQNPPVLN